MAIRTVVTAGFGNGTFNGTIGLTVTRGYGIGAALDLFSNRIVSIQAFDRITKIKAFDRIAKICKFDRVVKIK